MKTSHQTVQERALRPYHTTVHRELPRAGRVCCAGAGLRREKGKMPPLTSQQRAVVMQFMSLTGATDKTAQRVSPLQTRYVSEAQSLGMPPFFSPFPAIERMA